MIEAYLNSSVATNMENYSATATLNVKQIFDKNTDIVIDPSFISKLSAYRVGFANKNPDHIAFFGGALMGVHPVRFKTEDRNKWFDDILNIDDQYVEDQVHQLRTIVPYDERGNKIVRHVSQDIMNLSCLWLVHAIYNSPKLNHTQKEQGMIDTLLVLQYKFITSILTNWFTYNADPVIASATYSALSLKFALRRLGSWGKVLEQRARDIISQSSIHYRTIVQFDDDKSIVYMCNDIQGRIKDILKNVRDVFTQVQNTPSAQIKSLNTHVKLDGEAHVRDLKRIYPEYRDYLHSVISDRNTFIRGQLVDLVVSAMQTMPRQHLEDTLTYMSLNYGPRKDPQVAELVDKTLSHTIEHLSTNKVTLGGQSDIGGLISRVRSLYMASRTSDEYMLELRDLGEDMVIRSANTKSKSTIAATRTGVLMYIVLRAFTKHYFSK